MMLWKNAEDENFLVSHVGHVTQLCGAICIKICFNRLIKGLGAIFGFVWKFLVSIFICGGVIWLVFSIPTCFTYFRYKEKHPLTGRKRYTRDIDESLYFRTKRKEDFVSTYVSHLKWFKLSQPPIYDSQTKYCIKSQK